MIGLLMGLIVATILVYGRTTRNEIHAAWNAATDRPREQTEAVSGLASQ